MDYCQLGGSGPAVSRICLGTMTFGEQNDLAQSHEILDAALSHGVNFIDVAEMYPVPARAETTGQTEKIVGQWLRHQSRESVYIATKVAGPSRKLDWIRGGPLAMDHANIRAAVDSSLQRLQTDYIDLYQLHWPERNQPMFGEWQYDATQERDATPIRTQLEALAEQVQAGKIRAIGLSNEHPWGVMTFLHYAREFDLPRVVSIQNAYNLLNRVFEYGLAEVCQREGVGLLPYSVLAFGHLTAKYLTHPQTRGRLTLFPEFGQRYCHVNVLPAVQAYADLAREHGLSPAVLAQAFVYRRPFVASTIIGATSVSQLEENLSAWEVVLDAEILQKIDDIHRRYSNPAP